MPDNPNEPVGEEVASKLISLAQAAEISGFTPSHLRLLARQGKLWATKLGRDWLTTEAAVREYLAKERKRGPKPRD
ncbi:MAG: helix-turn-helix domain-containing protein [Chloroflexi bacterium]|nr:helix-turn-helix domain-containing protein [Chloroflexota bacterium]